MSGDEIEGPVSEREQALRSIKRRRDLGAHALSFVLVNGAVWAMWAFTGSGYPWPVWITGIWAIGLVANAWDVYARPPVTEQDVQQEIRRLRARHGQ